MIRTVFQIAVLRLWNNKQELLVALFVPILFFSIFALIFGRGVGSDSPAIRIALVDDDKSPLTKEIVRLLKEQPALRIESRIFNTMDDWPLEKLARTVVRDRAVDVVIYLPAEMERKVAAAEKAPVQLLSEGTNPLGRQIVSAMLSQIVATTVAANQRSDPIDRAHGKLPIGSAGRLPPVMPAQNMERSEIDHRQVASSLTSDAQRDFGEPITFETKDIFAADKHDPKIAMYAAGIAVMFLLFSATGAGGSLLEEQEAGTLDRLLSSRLNITQLLAGKWVYITCLGCVQLTVMFVWAQFAFGVDLVGHLPGFAVMTLCTAAATASLALCLAVICRSRAQLNGVSIVVILAMSALGGSMVPRYIMSEEMRFWGQFTFNAWALDGFKKVFWYDLPVSALTAEVLVLLTIAIALANIARICADRWEAR